MNGSSRTYALFCGGDFLRLLLVFGFGHVCADFRGFEFLWLESLGKLDILGGFGLRGLLRVSTVKAPSFGALRQTCKDMHNPFYFISTVMFIYHIIKLEKTGNVTAA